MILLRAEHTRDHAAVGTLHEAAFGGPTESKLVEMLRRNCPEALSLVAIESGMVVGHILFTPARLEARGGPVWGMGLAPMAVLPTHQNRGIGSLLVREGLEQLRTQGCPFVIVLGHPHYYPRFGFEPASHYGVRCPWEGVPDQAFMIQFLQGPPETDMTGTAFYRAEFNAAM